MAKSNRIFYLDVLRAIACLSVIMIHSSSYFVIEDIGSFNFWTGNILNAAARIGVALFVMISGALMLDKNYQFSQKKLKEHIVRMVVFFVFWSLVYSVVFNIAEPMFIRHESINIADAVKSFIKGHSHLWFVYLIIGLYLIVPLLRLWVNENNKKYVEYFIVLSIVFTYLIPQILSIGSNYSDLFKFINTDIIDNLGLKYIGGFTAYFILGWYINNFRLKNEKLICIFAIAGLLISAVGTYVLSITTGKALQMYDSLSINVLLQSTAVFIIVKNKFKDTQGKNNKFINSVSKYSLGIYAVHQLFVAVIHSVLIRISENEFALINIPVMFAGSFILAYICTFILSKIPGFRKLV